MRRGPSSAPRSKSSTPGLTGRVAVAARGEGFSGSLRYQQQSRQLRPGARWAPRHGRLARGARGRGHCDFHQPRREARWRAARAELERRLGFQLPIAELRWWLLGIPAPGEVSIDPDAASGEIRGFLQDGWKISIDSRAPALGFALPQRLTATREGARLKLLVERWQP